MERTRITDLWRALGEADKRLEKYDVAKESAWRQQDLMVHLIHLGAHRLDAERAAFASEHDQVVENLAACALRSLFALEVYLSAANGVNKEEVA